MMLQAIFWTLVGAFVGWHVPEPAWAQAVKKKALDTVSKFKQAK
jgi:hypothetical protein